MLSLFKLVFEFILAGGLFVGGIMFAIKYPNAAAKINAVITGLFTKKTQ